MSEDKKPKSIFQGVVDAINGGKKRTPEVSASAQFTPSNKTSDLVNGDTSATEVVQQQFLDWQVNKISHNLYTRSIYFDTDRISAYQDFRAMDMSPEVAAALNIIRDEALTKNEYGDILSIYSENERVKEVLKDLFRNRINVEYNLKLWIRDLIKYGDYFVFLEVDKNEGIYNFMSLPVSEIHREEGYDGKPDSVRFRWETMGMYFEDWQVAHFRIIEDTSKLYYGRSILDPARKLWKQLQLAEDSMLVYRMCLEGNTRIRTNNGYKYIKDICEGDTVISYNEKGKTESAKVIYHVNNGKKKLLKIRSKHTEIVCTETHPILVNTNGLIHYIDAKDIIPKKDKIINVNTKQFNIQEKKIERIYDEKFAKLSKNFRQDFKKLQLENKTDIFRKIEANCDYPLDRTKQFAYSEKKAIPYGVAVAFCDEVGFDSYECLEIVNKGEVNSERIALPEYVDEEFARLLGFIMGDGNVTKHGFNFTSGVHKDVNEYYSTLMEKYFGEVVFNLDKRSKIGTGKYCVNNKIAADILRNLGIKDTHDIIRIPEWVFNLPHNKRKEFVLGFSDADGCERRTKKGTWFSTIELSNKRLVEDIKELWHSIGLASGQLKERNRKGGHLIEGRVMPSTTAYSVTISEIELPKYENVISIEDAGEDFVYDISVDNSLHNFVANGIPVHNTRAPERRVFYIEVGNLGDTDVQTYMMKIQNQLKKQPQVDQRNGQFNLKYDPMNITEDFFIPIRGDKSSKIDTLPGACLALNTKIDLLDGRSLELNQIIEEFSQGKELWSYSINPNTGEIVPGRISWAGVTRKNTDVLKITLDNGETITCTHDHKFPTRFNGVKEAKDLLEGESLWSFNKKFEKIFKHKSKAKEYEMIYDHNQNDWVYTHRMVGNFAKEKKFSKFHVFDESNKDLDKNTIHHYNFCHTDNSPENLFFMNFHDHVMLHQSMSKKYIQKRKIGIKEYWANIPKEEFDNRIVTSIKNFKKGSDKLQELLKDEDYKKAFYEKTSASLKIAKNTKENKDRQSGYVKAQWKNDDFRNAVIEKQTIKYSDTLLQFVVNRFKDGLSAEEILRDINEDCSLFMLEFNSLNSGNKQLKKMKNGFTQSNLSKMMKNFGYANWKDFKSKVEFFNHKIVSIEFLKDKQDTGTITIDGNELYHNFHNFALSCGAFTLNSNMGDIQDIQYLQNKLFASLQVPKAYLNYAENLPGGSTLSQADLRFARTINSIQEVVILELRRIANIHLYFAGLSDEIDNFTLTLTNPSTQQELLKLETMKARMEVFKEMYSAEANSPVSYTWAMENLLGFSKATIKLIQKQKKIEKKLFAEIDSAVETYKKIGLFRELDAKYELPGGSQTTAGGTEDAASAEGGGGGGGGGGAGDMGNLDLGSQLGGMEASGGGEVGGSDASGGGEAAPLAEDKSRNKSIKMINEILKQSDNSADELLNELLGDTKPAPTTSEREEKENKLQDKNNKINFKVKRLIDSIQKTIDVNKQKESKDGERLLKEEKSKNTLFERSNDIINKTNSVFDNLEKMIGGNFEEIENYSVTESSNLSESEEFVEESPIENETINEVPDDFFTGPDSSESEDNQ